MYVSFIFVAIIILTYIGIELTQKPEHALFFKGIASFSFIIVWSLASLKTGILIENQILILLGLVLGLLGDITLGLRPLRPKVENEDLILRGMSLFSFGHFFYLLAILTMVNFHYLAIIVGGVVMLGVIIMSKKLKFEMGKTTTYNYLYAFLLFFMVGQSIGVGIETGFQSLSILLIVGFGLFGLSDLVLASIYYQNKQSKWLIALNLLCYYGAQVCIAASILYL